MLNEILASDWLWYFLGGFGVNGFITQAVALTPTKKDDEVLNVANAVIKTVTGTFGLRKVVK